MPKYVIERDIPGAGQLTADDLKAISQKSCGVLQGMGPQIQWIQSYVTDDKVYCIYCGAQRGSCSRTRPPGRISRQPGVGSTHHHRPDHGRIKSWVAEPSCHRLHQHPGLIHHRPNQATGLC